MVMPLPKPRTLFQKTLFTIALVSLGFQVFTLTVLAWLALVPLGQRATDDLASIMTHASERWIAFPPDERQNFTKELWQKHNLVISQSAPDLPESTSLLPYLIFLEQALVRHQGQEIKLKSSRDRSGNEWFWADLPVSGESVRIGFTRSRIGVQPPMALVILLVAGMCLTFATAIILTRRLTIPVERLYQAACFVGKGCWSEPIREEGPTELVALTQAFNRMNHQIKELLANRTSLLAGIVHDLRTPLTQVQLALAMLPDNGGNPPMMASIREDLEAINQLISKSLSVSLELVHEEVEMTDITDLVDKIVANARRTGAVVRWNPGDPCHKQLRPLALSRILVNLLENAIRYGGGKPVEVGCECGADAVSIQIIDYGFGIPENEKDAVFRPFYRLEKPRSSSSGGSGLGLSIVHQLADANGWNVALLNHARGGICAILSIGGKQHKSDQPVPHPAT
jgi:two-component system osmolarity sensor histidine kinase EnvZ